MFVKPMSRTTALLAFLALSVTASVAEVKTDYDHKANFKSYRTFSFYKVQMSDPLFDSRVTDEITKDLAARGWTMVQTGGDVTVSAIGNTKDEQEYNTFYDGLGGGGFGWGGRGGWGYGGGFGRGFGGGGYGAGGLGGGDASTTVQNIPVGTLVVDLYDTKTHQIVFRGNTQETLSNKADKNAKKLNKDIDKMFKMLPEMAA